MVALSPATKTPVALMKRQVFFVPENRRETIALFWNKSTDNMQKAMCCSVSLHKLLDNCCFMKIKEESGNDTLAKIRMTHCNLGLAQVKIHSSQCANRCPAQTSKHNDAHVKSVHSTI